MDTSDFVYNGQLLTHSLTVPDENSFFHSTFGTNDDDVFFDKHVKVRRMRWAAFLTYYQNEPMPPRLAELLQKCLLAHEEYKEVNLGDPIQFERYISGVLSMDTYVTVEELPIIATLENVKVTVLLDQKGDKVVVAEPDGEILGNYKIYREKPREVFVCLEEQTFSRLESIAQDVPEKPIDQAQDLLRSLIESLTPGGQQQPQLNQFSMKNVLELQLNMGRTNFMKDKNPYDDSSLTQTLAERYEQCLDCIRSLALQSVMEKEQCELFTCYREISEELKEDVLSLGIVGKVGNRLQFCNIAFVEYLVAQCLLKELQLPNEKMEFQKLFVENILTSGDYGMIRGFFEGFLLQSLDSIPATALRNYQSYAGDDTQANDQFKLIYMIVMNGYVAILRLLFKCVGYEIVRDKEVDILSVPEGIRRNSLNVLQFLLRQGGLNIVDNSRTAPIHLAVQRDKPEMVRFLVEQGADVNLMSNTGATPLHMAAGGSTAIVRLLLELGANENATDERDVTPLHVAAQNGSADTVRLLVENGAKVDAVENRSKFTPLHEAGIRGRWEIARLLVQLGANFRAEGSEGSMLVNLYTSRCQLDLVKYLAGLGADLNVLDDLGDTPLLLAVSRNTYDIVKGLVELGADVNKKGRGGCTPLHFAALYNQPNSARLFLENGADADLKEGNGNTALHLAAARGHLDCVKVLLEFGAAIDVKGQGGVTALHLAAIQGQLELIRFLVEKRADVSVRDAEGRTALEAAQFKGQTEAIQLLRELGCT